MIIIVFANYYFRQRFVVASHSLAHYMKAYLEKKKNIYIRGGGV